MSEMQAEHTERLPYEYIKIGLTRDRKEFYAMIDERVDVMFEQGLVDEVEKILALLWAATQPAYAAPDFSPSAFRSLALCPPCRR